MNRSKYSKNEISRYSTTPADLASLHTLCRTAHHRMEALQATVLSCAACGLGITDICKVKKVDK